MYVTWFKDIEVDLRQHRGCTHEIPVTSKGTGTFVDPFNLIIRPMATPVICCEETPPRWRIEGEWVWRHPKQGSCEGPLPMPVHLYEHRGDRAQGSRKNFLLLQAAYHSRKAETDYHCKGLRGWGSGLS
jgi:hypothetical protein